METNQTYYSGLIHKYFSGEAGFDEIKEISHWIGKDENNRKEFDDVNEIFQLLQKKTVETVVNVDDEWVKFKASVSSAGQPGQEIYTLKPQPLGLKLWMVRVLQYAAIFVILAVGGYFVYSHLNRVTREVLTATSEVIKESLPDGTKVTLSTGTTLSYPSKFKESKRKVKLEGEASFEVVHDESQPFLVDAGIVQVEVLGTVFYVNTNADGNHVEVKVTSGRVAVFYSGKPESRIILHAGENIVLSKSGQEEMLPETMLPSVSGKIEFDDQPLSSIILRLNKIYRTDIRIEGKHIGNCRMTATFENQTLDAVLNVIKATLDVTVAAKGKTIVITGEGCK